MLLEELLEKIDFESRQYTSIHNVEVFDQDGRKLEDVKCDISANKVTFLFGDQKS